MCNVPNYKLATYLVNMTKEHTEKTSSDVKDSFHFVNEIKKLKIEKNEIMMFNLYIQAFLLKKLSN